MTSPLLRRIRLGNEVRQLRKAAGFGTLQALASAAGVTRREIQALEGGERDRTVNFDVLAKVRPALGADDASPPWRTLMKIARDASDAGWWKSPAYRGMGPRQILHADLESGAAELQTYEPTAVHGLLQTEAYTRALVRAVASDGEPVNTEAIAAARLRRQEQAETAGTRPDILMEEVAIRRPVAPPLVMAEQLRHLIDLAASPPITLRILPIDADFADVRNPREAFTHFRYADPADPTLVLVETVTDDDILLKPDEIAPYQRLFDRCADRALPPAKTLDLIADAADSYAGRSSAKSRKSGKSTRKDRTS